MKKSPNLSSSLKLGCDSQTIVSYGVKSDVKKLDFVKSLAKVL